MIRNDIIYINVHNKVTIKKQALVTNSRSYLFLIGLFGKRSTTNTTRRYKF